VAINNGICESSRTPVTATIEVVPKPGIVTSNCTATGATLTGPAGFSSYAWSNGATTQAIAVNTAGTYTLIVTSSGGCNSPASDPVTFAASFCNQPPVLQPTPVTTTVQGTITVNVSSIATDLDNNIDLSTLQVITQPASGATAFINANFELVVDYAGVTFAGTDQLTIQLCDVAGACAQEVITIEVAGDITVFNALSPNGDGKNDVFFIEYINALPETQQNKVTILNRWGSVVFETTNYDNTNNVFRGLSDSGTELPSGTYYYVLEFASGAPKRTGFISLRK
jgi:gliding motility-associated-like protein